MILEIMKKSLLILMMVCGFSFNLLSQSDNSRESDKRSSLTIGILQGGGSLFGVDFELLLSKRIGFQVGGGIVGYGGGFNIHFKPTIRSSFLSIQYWHQGIGNSYSQSLAGPNFVFRGKKWFTFQIGAGTALGKGPAWPEDMEQPSVMLMYSIGGYIPL